MVRQQKDKPCHRLTASGHPMSITHTNAVIQVNFGKFGGMKAVARKPGASDLFLVQLKQQGA